MAKAKNEAKAETKKYIAKAVLVDPIQGVIHPDQEIELAAEYAERLLDLGAIEEAE